MKKLKSLMNKRNLLFMLEHIDKRHGPGIKT